MAQISINNGHSFTNPEDAIASMPWDTIVAYMDDDAREAVHRELAPCSEIEFLNRYLEIAANDLVIG